MSHGTDGGRTNPGAAEKCPQTIDQAQKDKANAEATNAQEVFVDSDEDDEAASTPAESD